MTSIQAARPVAVTTPLGEDVLLLHRMTATEELGRMFRFDLDLLSTDSRIKFEKIIGQNITIRLDLPDNKKRYFNGYVSRFSQEGTSGNYHAYRATVQPWLWFLTRTADCRIFQQKTIPDIIMEVFREHGFTDIRDALSGVEYRTWEYCVQYRETDFNFVSRLMEQEGIYYFFTHEQDKHTLVLANSMSSHEAFPDYGQISYYPPENQQHRPEEHIYDWSLSQEIQPGIYALNDYDFKQPKANLQVKSSISRKHDRATMEIYDYPGEYVTSDEGEAYVRTRVEELQAAFEQAHGQANARGIAVGSTFNLQGYPRTDQNREYLVVSATHILTSDAFDSASSSGDGEIYSCSFAAMHIQEVFRPARLTPKPMVQGPQTAVVVGPSGDEIHTDKYGRVKVQFHWDRYGKLDENSSCWMRVAQIWAGAKWGGIHIPRIGHEVIVEFLEGDPDQPIITGRVYNNDNMPPYDLPSNATQSGIKSKSSAKGNPNNLNELRFEDKKGDEQIFIHAEKNMDIQVKNDRFETIGSNRHLHVSKDKKEHIENNRHEKVINDHYEEIGKDRHLTIKGKEAKAVDASHSFTVKGDVIEVFKANHSEQTTEDYYLKATNIVVEAMTNVTVKVGQSFIAIEAGGIKIGTSGQIVLEAQSTIDAKGTAGVTVESPATATLKSANTTIKGDAMTTIQGGLVKIN